MVAVAGDTEAVVSFAAPASDGGSPITSYTVTSSPEAITASGTESPITVTGLTNGSSYTFTVTASNAMGEGKASEASNAVIPAEPATVPDAPTATVATLGENWDEVSVAFTAPSSDGGAAITGYTVTSTPGGITATATESPLLVTGLSLNTAYTFTVHATNEVGDSEESSASNEVTTPETTSIEEQELSAVKVYWNEAGIVVDMLSLKGQQDISIYSIRGRLVHSSQSRGGIEYPIQEQLESGVYIVEIRGGETTFSQKIMVN